MKQQQGFTLIELVVVIIILGVLAAIAVPQFLDLSDEAEQSALRAQASALTSASSMNFAAWKVGNGNETTVGDCEDAAGLVEGGLDARYEITAETIAADATAQCTLTAGTNTATFTAHGVP